MIEAINVLGVRKSDDDFYDYEVDLPWYGKQVTMQVYFDRDDEESSPTPKQIQAFKDLITDAYSVFSKLESQLYDYYLELREVSRHEDYFDSHFPEVLTPNELVQYLRIPSIMVSYYSEDWSKYIGLVIDCDWDIDLGVGVKLIKNLVREICVQDIVI